MLEIYSNSIIVFKILNSCYEICTGYIQLKGSQALLLNSFHYLLLLILSQFLISDKKNKNAGTLTNNPRSIHAEIAFRQLRGIDPSPSLLLHQNMTSPTTQVYQSNPDEER